MNLKNIKAWFPGSSQGAKKPFLLIKESMLILLILYPIVMLQFKFLSPWTKNLNLSVATFIGNAISVTLITFPMMPICLYLLGWWLSPECSRGKNILGFVIVILLYLIEIWLFY